MQPSVDAASLPALAGIDPQTDRLDIIRPLTESDKKGLEQARETYAVASPIMTMYGILHFNHQDLVSFTATLAEGPASKPDPVLNSNRLILNYLAAADALLDHFSAAYKRQCRLNKQQCTGFDDLRRELEETNEDFQFFVRFRDHVLHAGLPVGMLTVTETIGQGKNWAIQHSAKELMNHGRGDLAQCRLLNANETIDLIEHLEKFHGIIMNRLLKEIVSCFRQALGVAQAFHRGIAEEVRAIDPVLRPCVLTTCIREGPKLNWTFDMLPVDLAASLGLRIKD